MKTALTSLLVVLGVSALSSSALADPKDRASEIMARDGYVAVSAVGQHVEIGTFRVQVAAKLGRPDVVLADGTWIYHRHRIVDSTASGSLVVQFNDGRVSALTLMSAERVAGLQFGPRESTAKFATR
jgi:hypothetical protein